MPQPATENPEYIIAVPKLAEPLVVFGPFPSLDAAELYQAQFLLAHPGELHVLTQPNPGTDPVMADIGPDGPEWTPGAANPNPEPGEAIALTHQKELVPA